MSRVSSSLKQLSRCALAARGLIENNRVTSAGNPNFALNLASKWLWLHNASRGFATGSRSTKLKRLSRASQRLSQLRPAIAQEEQLRTPEQGTASLPTVAGVVGHSALVITRPVEWGTLLLGFEQANRYTVHDEGGTVVAHLLEEEGSIGRAIGRQLFKTRRSFTATVLSPDGQSVIFRLRRPMYLISSTVYIENGEGETIGEVQQRWHLWRRRYDLFLGQSQFAAVDGGFLAWEFELKDERGGTLALIDRNFSGFGKELFTDAGRYCIHFGGSAQQAARELRTAIAAAHPDRAPPPVTQLALARTDVAVIPTSTGNQLQVHRPLQLDERMIALAAAISIDYDFFSRHSYGGGVFSPFMSPPIMPFPVPMGGGGEGMAEEAAEGGADGAGAESSPPPPPSGEGEFADGGPLERDLGGDEWGQEQGQQQSDWGWGGGGNDDDGGDEEGGGLSGILGDVFGWGSDD